MTYRTGACAALLALMLGTAAPAEVLYPAGGAIGMDPPSGFVPAEGYAGFQNPAQGVSLVFAQFPASAWPDMPDGMTADALTAQGLERPTRRSFPVSGREGLLVEGRQGGPGTGVSKWLLVFQGEGFTGFINASVPAHPAPPEARAAVEAALGALALRPPSLDDQRAALPFTFAETEHLRFNQSLMGNTVLLAPPDTRPGGAGPAMIVASSRGPVAAGDRAALAEASLRALPQFREVTLDGTEPASVAGAEAIYVRARAVGATDRNPRRIAYWVAFPAEGGLLRALADAPAEAFDAALPEFRQVVAGLTRR